MGFLHNLLYSRDISRTEELLRQAPAPSLFLKLIHLYQLTAEEEKSHQMAELGARMFPDNEELRKACLDVTRVRNAAEKARLQARLEQFPSPVLYAQLAELFLQEEDLFAAARTCDTGCREFPKYGGLWCIKARIAIGQDNVPEAFNHLQTATRLDHYNYDALMLQAKLFQQVGNFRQAMSTLRHVLEFSPADEKALKQLRTLEKMPVLSQDAPDPDAPTEVEAVPVGRKISPAKGELGKRLEKLGTQDGITGALLWDPFGLVIAGALRDGQDEELAAAMLAGASRSMDGQLLGIGSVDEAVLECEKGAVHIFHTDDMTLAVFADPAAKTGMIQHAVRSFIEETETAEVQGEAGA